jgi:sirohydrochlorin cobaltochelatase
MKKMLAILFAMVLALSMLTACGSSTSSGTEDTEAATQAAAEKTEAAVEEEEKEDALATGDLSKDDPLNQDDIGEKEILVVSFGTSFNDSRVATIGGIEKAIAKANPDWAVRRAFTAQIVIDHIKDYANMLTDDQKKELGLSDDEIVAITTNDDVDTALKRAVNNGVKELVVAPTHLMSGNEYDELVKTLDSYLNKFDKVEISKPLLTSDADKEAVAKELIDITKEYDDGETAIVFMGHGTDHKSNSVYTEMEEVLRANGGDNYFVGVVHDGAKPDVDDVIAAVKEKGDYKKVVLRDMMVVAGDHANNDMSDPDDPDSWYSKFKDAGYDVTTVIEGLGQVPAIQKIYVDHVAEAVDAISK